VQDGGAENGAGAALEQAADAVGALSLEDGAADGSAAPDQADAAPLSVAAGEADAHIGAETAPAAAGPSDDPDKLIEVTLPIRTHPMSAASAESVVVWWSCLVLTVLLVKNFLFCRNVSLVACRQ
jgi:hypothetical protein